ncbi:MAG TPA: flavin reductase family protein [Roseiflexaceae bacterium]|nr:flavin reductase family protein [Roseiflexaceae bacterium]
MTNIEPREFRRTIGLFATGVTVITTEAGGVFHGMTANSITSVSLSPLLVLVCVDRRARMAGMLGDGTRFAINILSDRQEWISRHFAGKPGERPVPLDMLDGVPTIQATLATLACTVDRLLDGGDHIIVMARVDALARPNPEASPLLYFGGEYRSVAATPAPDVFSEFLQQLPFAA